MSGSVTPTMSGSVTPTMSGSVTPTMSGSVTPTMSGSVTPTAEFYILERREAQLQPETRVAPMPLERGWPYYIRRKA